MKARGLVRMEALSAGRVVGCRLGENLFLNEGADILARVVAGDPRYIPGYVYFEFQNGGDTPTVVPTVDEGRSYYAGLETSGPPLNRDYLRVPMLARATRSASAEDYEGNVVNFSCITAGNQGVSGLAFSVASTSQVYGLALVAAPVPADRSQDRVFARWYPAESMALPASGQLVVHWPYRFTA